MSELFTSQKDKLYNYIRVVSGLDPSDFEWNVHVQSDDGGIGERLFHTPTKFYFSVRRSTTRAVEFNVEIYPASHTDCKLTGIKYIPWEQAENRFQEWIDVVRREHETPDFWNQLAEGPLPTLKPDVDEEAKFTKAEVEKVNVSVDQLVGAIRDNSEKLDFTREQLDYLIGGVEDLKSLAPSLTKRQFKHTLAGIAFTLLAQVAYNPERTTALMIMIGEAFDWLMQVNYYLPKGG